jgi:hypothetical protein
MKKDQHEQSERFSEQDRGNYVIMISELILILCFSFRIINHMALKTICIDPLSTRYCTSCHEQEPLQETDLEILRTKRLKDEVVYDIM